MRDDFERRIEGPREVVNTLLAELNADLDVERGGFGWWHGYLDARRIALLSEYLIAATEGVSSALLAASLEVQTFEEQKFAEDFWLRARWRALADASIPAADARYNIAMSQRNAHDRRRELQIQLAAEHTFYHLSRTLDRLAAFVIGVGALKVSIVKADWQDIQKLLAKAHRGWAKPLDDAATDGRGLQEALLDAAAQGIAAGPADWLPWLLAMRNTSAHRAPMFMFSVVVKEEKPPPSLSTPFPKQPSWPSVEAMASRPTKTDEFGGLLLLKDPLEQLIGMLNATSLLAETVIAECLVVWNNRRDNQRLLVQPGTQWRDVGGTPNIKFDGFGDQPIRLVPPQEVRVHPSTGRRLQAAKLMDDSKEFWTDDADSS